MKRTEKSANTNNRGIYFTWKFKKVKSGLFPIRDPDYFSLVTFIIFQFQGGFAKCYELRHMTTNDIWAGKIVPKSLLVKQHQREKMAQEITLHKTLSHKYVVKLNSFFEDSNFVYIILELCRRRSLMELHKRRKAVTEPETRYFMNQILLGVKYLHNQKIIHRDLKLGNIFLNDEMEVNILKKNGWIDFCAVY